MKQSKIIEAYKATNRIKDLKDIPNDIAYTFYKIRKLLQPQWDFQLERENALKEKYGFTFEEGKVKFNSQQDAIECDKEMFDLANMDIELSIEKQTLKITDRPLLTVSEMESLEDFLNYE